MNDKLLSQLRMLIEKEYDGNIQSLIRDLERALTQQKRAAAERPEGNAIISLQNVSKEYNMGKETVHALKNISLEVTEGEIIALIGPSGSGKSTLLQMIGALDTPTSGTVTVHGQNLQEISGKNRAKYRNSTIGFIFQFFHLQPYLSVLNNVEIPLVFRGVARQEREKATIEALEAVGLGNRIHHRPNQLSGGQMQRAAIARALVNNPRIILADEPTGNLDRKNAKEVMELLRKLNQERNTTMIIVTHDHFIADFADRVIELFDGEIKH